jgi:hypothetical protein
MTWAVPKCQPPGPRRHPGLHARPDPPSEIARRKTPRCKFASDQGEAIPEPPRHSASAAIHGGPSQPTPAPSQSLTTSVILSEGSLVIPRPTPGPEPNRPSPPPCSVPEGCRPVSPGCIPGRCLRKDAFSYPHKAEQCLESHDQRAMQSSGERFVRFCLDK